jgi:2-polyprenyl-3-methyl-5-hydroxy-6-metoxy-1,4-benzoquinol methylase
MEKIPGNYQYVAITQGRKTQRFWHQAKLRLIKRERITDDTISVIDIGCGSGVVSNYLAENCHKVLGVDLSETAIKFARQQYKRENLAFENIAILDLPKQGEFDLLFCSEVLEHLEKADVASALRIFYEIANPNAKLFITVPNAWSLWPMIERFLDTFKLVPKLKNEQHLSSFTKKTLQSALEENKWSVEKIGTFNGAAPFIANVSQYLALKVEAFEWKHGRTLPNNLIYCCAIKK